MLHSWSCGPLDPGSLIGSSTSPCISQDGPRRRGPGIYDIDIDDRHPKGAAVKSKGRAIQNLSVSKWQFWSGKPWKIGKWWLNQLMEWGSLLHAYSICISIQVCWSPAKWVLGHWGDDDCSVTIPAQLRSRLRTIQMKPSRIQSPPAVNTSISQVHPSESKFSPPKVSKSMNEGWR